MTILPPPISYAKHRRFFRRNASVTHRRTLDVLLSQARVTNLGFILLANFAFLSLLYNINAYFSYPQSSRDASPVPLSILSTLSRPKSIRDLSHLIIVPGHSIWKGSNPDLRMNEGEWVLESYQKGKGTVFAFVSHIERGAEIAFDDERSLLVFSGGQTRTQSATTEAESYLRLAQFSNLLPSHAEPVSFLRATTENYALDSFQNLIFSIARFHEYTGRWPEFITVVGFEMKRRRFEELHRAAVRWPLAKFRYVGIDAPVENPAAQEGELQNAYIPYSLDIYGCHSVLHSKRRSRNVFSRFHSYYTSSPELGPLLDWCPDVQTRLFDGPLPWDTLLNP